MFLRHAHASGFDLTIFECVFIETTIWRAIWRDLGIMFHRRADAGSASCDSRCFGMFRFCHGGCWEAFYVFASCGLVVELQIRSTAKI